MVFFLPPSILPPSILPPSILHLVFKEFDKCFFKKQDNASLFELFDYV